MNDGTTIDPGSEDNDTLLAEMAAVMGREAAEALDDQVRASFIAMCIGPKRDAERHRETWRVAVARLGEAMGERFVSRHGASVAREMHGGGDSPIELELLGMWSVGDIDGKPVVTAHAGEQSMFAGASPIELLGELAPDLGAELDASYPGLDLETMPESEPARALMAAHRSAKRTRRAG